MLDLLLGLAVVLASVLLSLGAYAIARRVSGTQHDRHRDMATAMVTRIAALHALIIALVFAQELSAYQRLETQMATEASAVANVYNDAARYDPADLAAVQQAMRDYLRIVVDREWDALGAGQGLDSEAWAVWDAAYEVVLDLTPQSPRQESLRSNMLLSLHAIAQARDVRESEAETSVANFFWVAALSGVVLIAIGHYIYPPERQNLVLLSLFSAYTGAILFLIFGFANPFSAPASLAPAPLQTLSLEIAAPAA